MNLFFQPELSSGSSFLDPDESRHAIKVLRKRTGDTLHLTDGKGFFYEALITVADASKCLFEVISTREVPPPSYQIHIAISPTKNADRIEWFVEKCVELGIDRITPLECENTERVFLKKDRLEKVAISAMKQSLKARLPVIDNLTAFSKLILNTDADAKYIAYVDYSNPRHLFATAQPDQHYLTLIGPEGDFSDEELAAALERGFMKVSLGRNRLRTETAGVAACHILNLKNS